MHCRHLILRFHGPETDFERLIKALEEYCCSAGLAQSTTIDMEVC